MGTPSRLNFNLEPTFFGFKPEDRIRLHQTIFDLIWWGDGKWDWDTIYNMPIFLRKYWVSQVNKILRDREAYNEKLREQQSTVQQRKSK
jgi:hypothetical protein